MNTGKMPEEKLKEFMFKMCLVLTAFSCNHRDFLEESNSLKSDLIAVLEIGEHEVIDLRSLVDFEFDTVYIFKPYTPLETIRQSINLNIDSTIWFNDLFRNAKNAYVEEDTNLILFTYKNKIVSYFPFSRVNGDFSGNRRIKYSKENAEFFVKKSRQDNGTDWVSLIHKDH